jgi:hypothetical protein
VTRPPRCISRVGLTGVGQAEAAAHGRSRATDGASLPVSQSACRPGAARRFPARRHPLHSKTVHSVQGTRLPGLRPDVRYCPCWTVWTEWTVLPGRAWGAQALLARDPGAVGRYGRFGRWERGGRAGRAASASTPGSCPASASKKSDKPAVIVLDRRRCSGWNGR